MAIAQIEAAREHLRRYPASCAARARREDAFTALYEALGDRAAVDATYRTLEDYVFSALVYDASRTCCWNGTTAAMAEIVMDYAEREQADAAAAGTCVAPTVFRSETTGYERWRAHAQELGRGAEWRAWSEDEACAQRDVAEDTVDAGRAVTGFCELDEAPEMPPVAAGCDGTGGATRESATLLADGASRGARLCEGEEDWYRVEADGEATVTITFDNAAGDLDLEAVSASGAVLSSSTSVANEESVTASGTFYVRVYGYRGVANAYTIALR
ncbi:MAG: PPC domain-containing protein [Sandaracinaceae bacterium]|nr:PPC domain-containing protein [Sandaracinaceae bacterium]